MAEFCDEAIVLAESEDDVFLGVIAIVSQAGPSPGLFEIPAEINRPDSLARLPVFGDAFNGNLYLAMPIAVVEAIGDFEIPFPSIISLSGNLPSWMSKIKDIAQGIAEHLIYDAVFLLGIWVNPNLHRVIKDDFLYAIYIWLSKSPREDFAFLRKFGEDGAEDFILCCRYITDSSSLLKDSIEGEAIKFNSGLPFLLIHIAIYLGWLIGDWQTIEIGGKQQSTNQNKAKQG
jgi:hypothetical protein